MLTQAEEEGAATKITPTSMPNTSYCASFENRTVLPLAKMQLGLNRHAKVVAAAERICDGTLDLQVLAQSSVPYLQAKKELMECDGVGVKIADCVCRFDLDKPEAFPLDTWIRRALAAYFRNQRTPGDHGLVRWAQNHFGRNAGLASQLLFRGRRP